MDTQITIKIDQLLIPGVGGGGMGQLLNHSLVKYGERSQTRRLHSV